MSIAVKLRRGTTVEHASFTGLEAEITVDTTKDTIVVHDGVTAGGIPLAKASEIPSVPDELADLSGDATHRLTTDTEKAKWNAKALAFYIDDTLTVETSAMSIIAPIALIVTEIRVAVDTAPTGAALTIDVNKNGTTMYTTQANRPTIAIDGTSATATDPDVTSIAVGDKISIDIDQIGSTVAGANLAVTVICEVA